MTKRVIGVIVLLSALLIAGAVYLYWRNLKIGANEPNAAIEVIKPAYFQFTDGQDNFIFKLNDQSKIAQAREIIQNHLTRGVMGTIVKAPINYNPPWSYYLDPSKITFFEVAPEVCDASIQMVEDHLDEVGGSFLPNSRWCPWNSKLIEEVSIDNLGDLNRDRLVNEFDLSLVVTYWQRPAPDYYLGGESIVNETALSQVLSNWRRQY